MHCSSPESNPGPCSHNEPSRGSGVKKTLTNDDENQRRQLRQESSSMSEEVALSNPQQLQQLKQPQQQAEDQERSGGQAARSVSSDDSDTSKESYRPDGGGIGSIGDYGVRQIMEPALRQVEAETFEIGVSIRRSLARNVEDYAELKCNSGQLKQLHHILSNRVDLCEKLFLMCLASVAYQLKLHVGTPDEDGPDPALVDAFHCVRRSAETLADRLRNSLHSATIVCERRNLPDTDADADTTNAEAAWSKAEATVGDLRRLIEAFGQVADRAVWRRLRHRRLRDYDWPGEPAIFAALTLRKKTLTASAGAAPKFHREEAVRYLLAAMISNIASDVETASSLGTATSAPAASTTSVKNFNPDRSL